MAVQLKPLDEQVIVITGASSGIGLATARMAAKQGAKLVLASRNGTVLDQIVKEIEQRGGQAVAVAADVSKREDLERVAAKAIETFGGFDSWVNDAAVAIYGKIEDVPLEDQRRLFDVNYWGVVEGSLIAARHLERKGGTIVNIGSVLSDRAILLQGPYSASKHAVKGFTDAFRMEIEEKGAPISVTLIKPSAIDTPYPDHARLYLDSAGPSNPPPSYDPDLVAKAILHSCRYPTRMLAVGFGGYAISLMGTHFPRLTDFIMEKIGSQAQKSDRPGPKSRRDNLYEPREDGHLHSSLPLNTRKTSLFLEAQMRPMTTLAIVAGMGAAAVYMLSGKSRNKPYQPRYGRPKTQASTSQRPETALPRAPMLKVMPHRDEETRRAR